MKKLFQIIITSMVAGLLVFTACTDTWEDMNKDPNNPTVVPAANVMVNAIKYFGDNFYGPWFNLNNTSTYAGQIGKVQYIDESRYKERESTINNAWRDLYRVIIDLQNAKKFAVIEGNVHLQAAALTFQSLVYLVGTDSWRDIPFTQAISASSGVLNPQYDVQENIYLALLDSLQKANELFAKSSNVKIGSNDILFAGNVQKWQKFANSLRLRIANRASAVSPSAKAVRDQILADATTYPVMTSNDDNAFLYWPGDAPYKEPWEEDSETRDDHAMGNYLIDYMVTTNDPRLPVYAKKGSGGDYLGVEIGPSKVGNIMQYSRIGDRFRGDAKGFTPFMRYCEVLFIKAEAQNDATAYTDGIVASCEENGIDKATASAFAATLPFSLNNLYYQKWVSLFKESHEAWAECRRTDVPVMSTASGSSYTGHNRPPFRFPYPTMESNLNSANVAPYLAKTADKFWGQQMWWDTRNNVN